MPAATPNPTVAPRRIWVRGGGARTPLPSSSFLSFEFRENDRKLLERGGNRAHTLARFNQTFSQDKIRVLPQHFSLSKMLAT